MKIILFLVLLFSFSTNAFAHGDTHSNNNSQFSMDTYLEKCGGEIYSDCPSQLEAVNAGLTHAKAIGSKILLVFGYDECPPCQWVNKIMKADKDKLKSFEKKYTIIKINSVLQEEEIKVEKMFSVEAPHYPSAFIIDPVTKSSQLNLPIHLAKSLTNLEEYLDATIAEQNKSIDEQIQSISSLGAASIELANKEIGLQLTDNKIKWVETDNKNFDDLVNQGIAYLHVFHYIDALRSFKAAEKLNNKSLYPKTGMILSYLSLSPSDSLPLLKKLLGDSIPLVDKATEREKMWFALAQSVFVFSTNASEKTYPNTLSPDEAFSQLLAKYPNDLEVLTLAAYQTRPDNAVELYKKAKSIEPLHTGANHYIVHMYEHLGMASESIPYAEVLAEQASYNAHAVHMLGHVLPDVGQWERAKKLFQQADDIHNNWAEKNGVALNEDWHYAHNLNLLAITEVALGNNKKAIETLGKACKYDQRACIQRYILDAAIVSADQSYPSLNNLLNSNSNLVEHLAEYTITDGLLVGSFSINDMKENESLLSTAVTGTTLKIMDWKNKSEDVQMELKDQLLADIKSTIRAGFPETGFDSWSTGLLNSIYLLKVAKHLGESDVEDAILDALKEKSITFEKAVK